MNSDTVSLDILSQQLRDLGIASGDILLVHCAFSRVGRIEGGPLGLIAVLQSAVGSAGTLVMPSMSDDDDHPFDVERTPCLGMGIVADTFWRLSDVDRSDSPHAFAARGPHASRITTVHPVDLPHGLDSPVGRVYELGGKVLLIGVGHDADTTIHLAESLAGVRYRRPKSAFVLEDGRPKRVEYGEIDHCCQHFNLVDGWVEEKRLQARGTVGDAQARVILSRDVVDVVTERLHLDETTFLHPVGIDKQCDEARQSLAALSKSE